MQTTLLVQALVITGGIFIAALTASLSYVFTKKQQVASEVRKRKEEYYKKLIKRISNSAIDNEDEEANREFWECINTSYVFASVPVINKLLEFHNFICAHKISRCSKEWNEWIDHHDKLLYELVVLIRHDLYGKEEKILSRAYLWGKNK